MKKDIKYILTKNLIVKRSILLERIINRRKRGKKDKLNSSYLIAMRKYYSLLLRKMIIE